ncbi:MAG: GCN5-related N-acetyltransferase [Fluviicola sp.]|jgi:RimJ/RimL family protein N-acetyltransferase|uniref:GNAT family N-acetyltransferase n=1 Tax=Fluviicola sp. TaxID=1917219 RepID=UPI002606BC15|nr:GNAT family N-acetyltransferase [Fluviicola sp.]MDF3028966.1 GCN5-related N-acetyltransferase [Fluviicola sp.]
MNKILETTRLYLREMTPEDAESAYLLNLDPEVIQYTGDDPFESIEEARDFLEKYESYQKYGFGRWGVILKETNEYLGWCGLKYTPELDEFDIGYRFMKKCWGKGYASEAAEACIRLGFEQFNMKTIVGRAMPANAASVRVLQKIGLTYLENRITEGTEEVIYIKHK